MKTTLGFLITLGAATVSCSSGAGVSGGDGPTPIANLPQLGQGGNLPENMTAGPGGVALTTISPSAVSQILTITPQGTVSTITGSSDEIITYARPVAWCWKETFARSGLLRAEES